MTRDLQQKKPKHPRRPQLPSNVIGQPVRRRVHTVVYKQKLNQYIDAPKLNEKHINELIEQTTFELNKINKPPPFQIEKIRNASAHTIIPSIYSNPLPIIAIIITIASPIVLPIVHMFLSTMLFIHIFLPLHLPRP